MNSRLRLRPPKQTLATTSGRQDLAESVPSGAKQCTPSAAEAQRLPLVSTRKPSKSPASQSGEVGAVVPTERPSEPTG